MLRHITHLIILISFLRIASDDASASQWTVSTEGPWTVTKTSRHTRPPYYGQAPHHRHTSLIPFCTTNTGTNIAGTHKQLYVPSPILEMADTTVATLRVQEFTAAAPQTTLILVSHEATTQNQEPQYTYAERTTNLVSLLIELRKQNALTYPISRFPDINGAGKPTFLCNKGRYAPELSKTRVEETQVNSHLRYYHGLGFHVGASSPYVCPESSQVWAILRYLEASCNTVFTQIVYVGNNPRMAANVSYAFGGLKLLPGHKSLRSMCVCIPPVLERRNLAPPRHLPQTATTASTEHATTTDDEPPLLPDE